MRAIPLSARQNILDLYFHGKKTREIAALHGYCVAAVRRVRQQYRERGTLEPETFRCGRKTLLSAGREVRLRWLVSEMPDATLAELGAKMDRPFPASTIDLWLRRLGATSDQRRALAARSDVKRQDAGRARPAYTPERARQDWCLWMERERASK